MMARVQRLVSGRVTARVLNPAGRAPRRQCAHTHQTCTRCYNKTTPLTPNAGSDRFRHLASAYARTVQARDQVRKNGSENAHSAHPIKNRNTDAVVHVKMLQRSPSQTGAHPMSEGVYSARGFESPSSRLHENAAGLKVTPRVCN